MIYTIYQDYFSTGEGRTVFLHITDAETKEDALKATARYLGDYADYFMIGMRVEEGFNPENRYIQECLSKYLIDKIYNNRDKAMLEIYCEQYFNFS